MKQQHVLDRSALPMERNILLSNMTQDLCTRYFRALSETKGEDFVDDIETSYVFLADYDHYTGALDENSIVIDIFFHYRGTCIHREQRPVQWKRQAGRGIMIVTAERALH